MKGTSLIVSVILAVAVLVLYILHFTGAGSGKSKPGGQEGSGTAGALKIAYVKADSLILNYDLAQFLHEEFTKKQEAFTSEYGAKRSAFEREASEFQQKLQRGGFLTEQRAVQERDRLVGKEQEITRLDQELSTKLAEMQQANQKQLIDSLINYLKVYNAAGKYDYILNSADILIGPETENITKDVLLKMNTRYQASKK
ncbi:MAG TPA: OmpH family outer membrane protein [Prolixibacteraceae bacterium]|nr:OmpH family outer membrane protein [Prolixibacteraceae bacterium]HPT30451.1 OmpH family outer membrane protein [Prolixibacteraceae bacterium]